MAPAEPAAPAGRGNLRPWWFWLAGLGTVLAVLMVLSIAVGSNAIGMPTVYDALFHNTGTVNETVVTQLRVPRTLLGLAVGAALGVGGALMQALTRNPLADPGLLGVNAGASAGIVLAIGALDITSPTGYVWFGLLGAAAMSVAVYVLGSSGGGGASPVRLALAGAAVTAVLTAAIKGALLLDPLAFDQFRFWDVGALAGRTYPVFDQIVPFIVVGLVIAMALARPLNALALGEEGGRALGVRVGRSRVLTMVAVTLLCGAATAAAGPIVFVGLAVPHIARALTGPDQRRVLPLSAVIGAILLLAADIVGRVVVEPGELEVGIVTAFVGAPVFIALVRRRIPQL
jgi:iron complex transport system permease protein